MLISLLRTFKFALQDFVRNIWLSITTVIILLLALFSINLLITVNIVSQAAIGAVKEKIDVNLFLKNNCAESDIQILKAKIENYPEVRNVTYISKADALEDFKQKHQDSPEILEALRELGKNPLSPTFVIKPRDVANYESLIDRLNRLNEPIIEARNYENHKALLSKVNTITNKVSQVGLMVSAIFVFITIMVVFNAVRVAIYTHRREIKIMRLVGASRWFIRFPYIFTGIFYMLIGTTFIVAVYYPFLSLLQPYLEAFFVGYDINVLEYFKSHFILIFGSQFAIGALINIIASLIAINRYSKV